jgi:hypothetical protein
VQLASTIKFVHQLGQQIHHQPKGQDKQKNKKQNKIPQVTVEEHSIANIPSKDTPWLTIKSKVKQ